MHDKQLTYQETTLDRKQKAICFLLSFLVVALGQPATCWWCALLAAGCGFAIFWRFLLTIQHASTRFWLGAVWFTLVQLVQLAWAISHPYLYIYGVWFFTAFFLGLQFGLICAFITPARVFRLKWNLALTGAWVLLEWSRLFILSGSSWNPVGLAFAGSTVSLQMASLWGVYGLSFWVMLVNFFALRMWLTYAIVQTPVSQKAEASIVWLFAYCLPFIMGSIQVSLHGPSLEKTASYAHGDFWTVLVQTNFPVEEIIPFESPQDAVDFVADEWRQILTLLQPYLHQKNDLIVTPEYVVPFGTFNPLFRHEMVKKTFADVLGKEAVKALPSFEPHLAYAVKTDAGDVWMVNNAYWAQAIANVFKANLVVGFEDREHEEGKDPECFNAAYFFCPHGGGMQRYEKRVLVPMAEYIPFEFCRKMAAAYGITGSFSPGKEAKVVNCGITPVGLSICYEETYGHLMRENRQKGAEVLVNLTNDGWYPFSSLPKQHFEHARLRTVEMGIPLIRSCNTGITGGIDCLGRDLAILHDGKGNYDNHSGALRISVPIYTYQTLYAQTGDAPAILVSAFCVLCLPLSQLFEKRRKKN